MPESTPCNICHLDNCEILIKDGFSNIVRCRNCKHIYRNPRKTKQEYTEIYHSTYYTPFNKESWYKRKISFFKEAIKEINRPKTTRGRLLDLGCGWGHFLDLARKDGWEVYGVEISEYATRIATEELKLNIFLGELKDAQFADNYFDVVTMWNFLDHLHEPLELLKEVHRILKKDGLVAIRIPNMAFQIPGFKFFKKIENIAWVLGIKNPFVVHTQGFSKNTLQVILMKAGFRDMQILNSRLRDRPVAFINNIFFALAQLVFRLTGRKIVIAPTIEAWAFR